MLSQSSIGPLAAYSVSLCTTAPASDTIISQAEIRYLALYQLMDKRVTIKRVPLNEEQLDALFSMHGKVVQILFKGGLIHITFDKLQTASNIRQNYRRLLYQNVLVEVVDPPKFREKHRQSDREKTPQPKSNLSNPLSELFQIRNAILLEEQVKPEQLPAHQLQDVTEFISSFCYQQHKEIVRRVKAITAKEFVTSSKDNTVRFYQLNQRKPLAELQLPNRVPSSLMAIGNNLLIGDCFGKISHALIKQRVLGPISVKIHNSQIIDMFKLTQDRYISGEMNRCIKLWKPQFMTPQGNKQQPIRVIQELTGEKLSQYPIAQILSCVKMNNQSIAFGMINNIALLQDLQKQSFIKLLHLGAVTKVIALEEKVMSSCCGQKILIWDVRQNTVRPSRMINQKTVVYTLKKIQNNKLVYGGHCSLGLIDLRKEQDLWRNDSNHTDIVRDIEFMGRGRLISVGRDYRVIGWQGRKI